MNGVLGPSAQVAAVKAALGIERDLQLDDSQYLYALDLNALRVPELLTSGRATARRAEPRDLELLSAWRAASSIESLHDEDSPALRARSRASIERYTEEGRMWVLESGGEPVSCSGFNSAIPEAVQVGAVWTPPELRRRGFARAVVAASLLDGPGRGRRQGDSVHLERQRRSAEGVSSHRLRPRRQLTGSC